MPFNKTFDALRAEMDLFNVRRYAILVDRSVDPAAIGPLVSDGLVGFFTFTVDVAGEVLHGRTIGLLAGGTPPPECDGWILGSIVLWAIATGLGMRGGKHYATAHKAAAALVARGDDTPSAELRALIRDRATLWMHVVAGAALLATLVLMIYKPGA